MATTTSITTTYAGEFAGKYISAALLSGKTLAEGSITVKPNVKYKEVVKKLATDGIVKDATCDFDDTSTITLTERILQPEEFQVNLELCKKDFRSDWEAIEMGYSAFDNLPPNFSDFLIGHVAAKVAQKTEQNIWGGVNATAGEFDGFTVLMAADSDVNDAANDSASSTNYPVFNPNQREVSRHLQLPLNELIDFEIVERKLKHGSAAGTTVPCFVFDEHLIWGATAMILFEFKNFLESRI